MARATFDMYFLLHVVIWWIADFELVVPVDGSNVCDNQRPWFAPDGNRNLGSTSVPRIGRPLVPAHHCQFPSIHPNASLEFVGLVQHSA